MAQQDLSPGQMVRAGGMSVPVTLASGQVRVHLPFAVDPRALSAQLIREGYALAHEPETPDTQGWGDFFDPEAYYPYWVYPDPENAGRSVFAFYPNPEDVVHRAGQPDAVRLGERSRHLVERWVPVLQTLQAPGEVRG